MNNQFLYGTISSATMVVAAVVLGLPVGVSVISGLTIYGGLNLIGRGVETFTNPDIAGEIEKGRSKLARFSELIGSVKRYENTHVDTIKKMEQIRDMSETIIDEIEKKEGEVADERRSNQKAEINSQTTGNNVFIVKNFVNIYLDTTLQIIGNYIELKEANKKLGDDSYAENIAKLEDILEKIHASFKEQYKKIIAGDIMDFETSIETMKNLINSGI